MLGHPKSDAPLCIMVDASDVAVGVFQQYVEWEVGTHFILFQKVPASKDKVQHLQLRIAGSLPHNLEFSPHT